VNNASDFRQPVDSTGSSALGVLEARIGVEPTSKGFAALFATTFTDFRINAIPVIHIKPPTFCPPCEVQR
jgi:hypothetical protein